MIEVMLDRPVTTLFLLQSLDGKISTGATNECDFDKDLPNIDGVSQGLHQYYEIEQTTDLVSFGSGRTQAKVGANERRWEDAEQSAVSFVFVDNKPHLNERGVEYFARTAARTFIVTTNRNHPAIELAKSFPQLHVIRYENEIDLHDVFHKLKAEHSVERVTIQTGGQLNAALLHHDLIDYVSVVVAPCLVGGFDTPTLVDGPSTQLGQLDRIRALELESCNILEDSYVHLSYRVSKQLQ